MERRTSPTAVRLELREDGGPSIVGYAAVFYRQGEPGTEYRLWDDVVERIDPQAFSDIQKNDVRALFNHDANMILGRSTAGTLRLSVDDRGLRYDITPPDTNQAQAVVAAIRRGDITGSSFAFLPTAVRWERADGVDIRTIQRAQVFDVGPVVYPAYEATSTGVRSSDGAADIRAELARHKARLAQRRAKVSLRMKDIAQWITKRS